MRISDWSSDVCSSDLFWALTSVVRNSCVAGAVPSPVNTFKATFGLAAINALPTSSGSNPPGPSNLDLSLVREFVSSQCQDPKSPFRSEEHTSELQSLMRISYAVFCLKKKNKKQHHKNNTPNQCNRT